MPISLQPVPNLYVFSPTNPTAITITADQAVTWSLEFDSAFFSSQGGSLSNVTPFSVQFNPPDDSLLGQKKMVGRVIAHAGGNAASFLIRSV